MAGNSFGQCFRITTAGESHGPGNVVIIDGVPAGLELSEADLLPDLARRRPGQSRVTTQRKEADQPRILSGVFEGRTTGTSLATREDLERELLGRRPLWTPRLRLSDSSRKVLEVFRFARWGKPVEEQVRDHPGVTRATVAP